jgi:hypothetical protein
MKIRIKLKLILPKYITGPESWRLMPIKEVSVASPVANL